MFWVASSLDRDLGDSAVNVAEIVCSQFDGSRSDVFFQAMQLSGAGDRNDPRFLGKQPSERNLSRCGFLPFCDSRP